MSLASDAIAFIQSHLGQSTVLYGLAALFLAAAIASIAGILLRNIFIFLLIGVAMTFTLSAFS